MAIRPKYGVYGTVGPAFGFTWDEVRCTDGTLPNDLAFRRRAVRTARALNRVRRKIALRYGIPFSSVSIIVNSWYRSPKYNALIKGARQSLHLTGVAVDLRIRVKLRTGKSVTLHPRFVAALSGRHEPEYASGGIGWYDASHGYFTHDDRRGVEFRMPRARWINVG